MTRDDAVSIGQKLLNLLDDPAARIRLTQIVSAVTRIAGNRILDTSDRDVVSVSLGPRYVGTLKVLFNTNQLDEAALERIAAQIKRMGSSAEGPLGDHERGGKRTYLHSNLWYESSVDAMDGARADAVPSMLARLTGTSLQGAATASVYARGMLVMNQGGLILYSRDTDAEVTMTARTPDGKGSGWAGRLERDWTRIDPAAIADRAIELGRLSANPVALEPGRRTAILGSAAVAQMLRFFVYDLRGESAAIGNGPFAKIPNQVAGTKIGERVADARVTIVSELNDPDGGYPPWEPRGQFPMPAKTAWIENGVLKNLIWDYPDCLDQGVPHEPEPYSLRLGGGTSTLDEMIATCKNGVYVNRFSDVSIVGPGLVTGVTRDGCFHVKDGKIHKAIKNFRFIDSLIHILNRLEMIGVPMRASFGNVPPFPNADSMPAWPWIAPPIRVSDFNFWGLSDAV